MASDWCEEERQAFLRRQVKRNRKAGIRPCDRKRHEWARRIKREYGLTPEDIAIQWDKQYGMCPICGADLTTKVWVIDHHHKTGEFRGLLCAWDNHRVLSMCERAGEKRIRNVVRYLKWSH